jgi:hypothetical protein
MINFTENMGLSVIPFWKEYVCTVTIFLVKYFTLVSTLFWNWYPVETNFFFLMSMIFFNVYSETLSEFLFFVFIEKENLSIFCKSKNLKNILFIFNLNKTIFFFLFNSSLCFRNLKQSDFIRLNGIINENFKIFW